eukprot:jgi/Ulvmu1/5913/UM026_0035.1
MPPSSGACNHARSVFFKVGARCWIQPWAGAAFSDLANAFTSGLPCTSLPDLHRFDVFLLDKQHGVMYNNFTIEDVIEGSLVECRNRVYLSASHDMCRDSAGVNATSEQGVPRLDSRPYCWTCLMSLIRELLDGRGVWSRPTTTWPIVVAAMSCLTLAVFVNRQLPSNYDPSPPYSSAFLIMESLCSVICLLEALLWIRSSKSLRSLVGSVWFWICSMSVVPLAVYMASAQRINLFEWTAVRLVFISRLLLSVPLTCGSMQACQHTVQQSARLLYMLLFFATLALLINSFILYYLERGTYSEVSQMWVRQYDFECSVTQEFQTSEVLGTYATGMKQLPTARQDEPFCVWQESVSNTSGLFICPVSLQVNASCHPIQVISHVKSIPEAMWMTVATLTTVGYGDIVPTSPLGQLLNSLVMYTGITVLALPMTVISSKFEGNFRRFKYT